MLCCIDRFLARQRFWTCLVVLSALSFATVPLNPSEAADKDPPKKAAKKNPDRRVDFSSKPTAPPAPRSAILTSSAWQDVPMVAAEPADIDRIVAKELEI